MSFPKPWQTIARTHVARATLIREVSKRSSDALTCAKRAIFAMHRENDEVASTLLAEAKTHLDACESLMKKAKIQVDVGAHHAALEEYAEARLFEQFLDTGSFGVLETRLMTPDVYLAALSDATGEAVRDAVRRASPLDPSPVEFAFVAVEEVVEYLLSLDLTGELRTKFDQAKKNLRSLEHMAYDLRLRDTQE